LLIHTLPIFDLESPIPTNHESGPLMNIFEKENMPQKTSGGRKNTEQQ
jgi:hypothetical protein